MKKLKVLFVVICYISLSSVDSLRKEMPFCLSENYLLPLGKRPFLPQETPFCRKEYAVFSPVCGLQLCYSSQSALVERKKKLLLCDVLNKKRIFARNKF